MQAKKEQKERLAKATTDRQKVIQDLLDRENAYKDALNRKFSKHDNNSSSDEDIRKAETELDKLIREIKTMEKEEIKREKASGIN